MKKLLQGLFVGVIICAGCAGYSQKTTDIVAIEFKSLARGYDDQVNITKDSISQNLTSRGSDPQSSKRKISAEEWQQVLASLIGVNLKEVSALKSPTMKRTYDGAKHSSLTITTSNGTTVTHSFDDEEPHEKLVSLMRAIRALRK